MGKYLNGTGLKATTVHCVWFYLCRQFADIVPTPRPHHDQTPVFLPKLTVLCFRLPVEGAIFPPNSRISQFILFLHPAPRCYPACQLAVSSGPIPSSSFLLHCSRLGPYRVTLAPLSWSPTWPPFLSAFLLIISLSPVFFVNNNRIHTNP